MKTIIEPEFKINDLVQHKFKKNKTLPSTNPNTATSMEAYEVLFITTETCFAGTQVFYHCRPISRIYHKPYGKDEPELIEICIGDNLDWNKIKFREDELVMCNPEIEQIIRS